MNKAERLRMLKRLGERMQRLRCVEAHRAVDGVEPVVAASEPRFTTTTVACKVCGREFDRALTKRRVNCSPECGKRAEYIADRERKKARLRETKPDRARRREEAILGRLRKKWEAMRRAFGTEVFTAADAYRALGISSSCAERALDEMLGRGWVRRTKLGVRNRNARWGWIVVVNRELEIGGPSEA